MMVEIYEQVQTCGNVVPRLYLLCCVGGVYISSLEAPAKVIEFFYFSENGLLGIIYFRSNSLIMRVIFAAITSRVLSNKIRLTSSKYQQEILNDMVEMIKGVQHPMRGLFLRNYLTIISKNKLPDVGSPYEGPGQIICPHCDATCYWY
jgi:vacuolar protein sorting-associated protein 35